MLELLLRASVPQFSTISRPDNNNHLTLSRMGQVPVMPVLAFQAGYL